MKKESVRDIPSEEGISPGMMDAGICVSIGTTEGHGIPVNAGIPGSGIECSVAIVRSCHLRSSLDAQATLA